MAKFVNSKISGTTVVLDGNEYVGVVFFQCRVVVTRGNFSLKECSFESCEFEFGGEAKNIKDLVFGLVNQPVHPPTPEARPGEGN